MEKEFLHRWKHAEELGSQDDELCFELMMWKIRSEFQNLDDL